MTETMDEKEILSIVEKVKSARYIQHSITGQPQKLCQWCNTSISGIEAFCSPDCKTHHEKAVQDYEQRRKDKDEMRWAR